jgi:hypothetical protein
MRRFASWCIYGGGWWWWWDLSWISTTYIGAVQLGKREVQHWSKPLYDAFLSGAWVIYFTGDALYWTAKPTVHTTVIAGSKRLHCEDYAALESDIENVYFWNGVMVPAFVVVRPDWITAAMIRKEDNQEVRRVMIERMGWERFCEQAEMRVLSSDSLKAQFPALPVSDLVADGERLVSHYRSGKETAELLESSEFRDFEDRPLRFVRVTDPSTGRRYIIRVAHDCPTPYAGIAASFGINEADYKKKFYIRQGDVGLIPLGKINKSQERNSRHS